MKKVSEDVNECVYCLPSHRPSVIDMAPEGTKLPKAIDNALKVLQQVVTVECSKCAHKDVNRLTLQLDGLKLL